ncbi:MAG: NAD(P)/FAD-dependent oxidoreductase [Alphaproteobacteria bacterium]|nr:NAD(P)/FAD-dependent oxidoreductase [Alphaproteobacteria bacterium]
MEHHKIVIIGGGPAGLALAMGLHDKGLGDCVVLEREQEAGGIPRHCGHLGFGFYNRRRVLTGPKFAAKLRAATAQFDVRTRTTVLDFTLRGTLRVQNEKGISEISADRYVLATGTRESSGAARLIGGARVPGVMNTGTLQQLVYLKHQKPFLKPLIVGSEWVSFSSLMTCRHAGITPVAMITEGPKLDAPIYFGLGARLAFGVPVKRNTKLIAVHGTKQVEAAEVETNGKRRMIACDGVVITGKFRAENALFSNGLIERDGTSPKVTQQFRTSKPNIYAVGNVLGHLETAGLCMVRARTLAEMIAGDLA